MHRSMVKMLGLAAYCAVAVGCSANSTTATNGEGIGRSMPLTRARAGAYAHSVNLRAADVPGMSAVSTEGEQPQTPSSTRANAALAHCFGGVSPSARLVKIHSPEFSVGRGAHSQIVQSTVEVWPTAALAAHSNASYFSSRGRKCFLLYSEALRRDLNKRPTAKLQIAPPRIATVAAPLPGASHGRLRTIDETLTRNGKVRIHIYHDIFTFIRGPTEVELDATGFSKPVATATDERLLGLLIDRAKTATP